MPHTKHVFIMVTEIVTKFARIRNLLVIAGKSKDDRILNDVLSLVTESVTNVTEIC